MQAAADRNVGAGPGFTPVRAVLNALATPAYAIGNLAAGRPGEAARNVYTLGQRGRKAFLSDTLRERGMLPGGPAGTVLGLAIDIFSDPVTYVTFGSGSALRQAGRAAAKRADDIVLREGRRLTLAERGVLSAEAAAERAAAPRALAVGARLPFTRGRVVWLGESKRIPKVASKVGRKVATKRVREAVRSGAKSGGGAADVVNEVYQDLRRLGGVEMRDIERAARKLDIDIKKAERALRLERGKGGELIARHLDNPARHPLPEGLRDLSDRARSLLDDFHRAEQAAGIEKGVLENYVPHLLARPRDRAVFERVYGRTTPNQLDDPFFVKAREAPTLDDFIAAGERHGFKAELNIARLIERRGRASVQARVKKALDDAIIGRHGLKPPPSVVPDTSAAAKKLAEARARLAELSARRDASHAQRVAAQARKAEQDARAALAAAYRTGDPAAVNAARRALREAQESGAAEVRRVAAERANESIPLVGRLRSDAASTRATLPSPGPGRFEVPITREGARRRLRRMEARLADLDAQWEPVVRETASELWHAPGGRFHVPGTPGHRAAVARAKNKIVRYTKSGKPVRRQFKETSARAQAMRFTRPLEDVYDEALFIIRQADPDHPALKAFAEAERIRDELVTLRDFVAPDPAVRAGAEFLGEAIPTAQPPTRVISSRARRARHAQVGIVPPEATTKARTPRARQAMRRYFTPDDPRMLERAEQVKAAAVRDVEQAVKRVDRRVEKLRKQLSDAQKGGSPRAIREARDRLTRAKANARQARLVLERTKAGYVGTPREVAAQTKRVLRAERRLSKAEQKAGAIKLANERLARRPGRSSSPEEWARALEEWTEIGTATKYHAGTRLPDEIADALTRVHRSITPTVRDQDAIEGIKRFTRQLSGRWKALALLSPGYHMRNLYDDSLRAYWAGARNPASFTQAFRMLRGRAGRITIRGKTYTRDDLIRLAESNGVIRTGWVRSEVTSSEDVVRRARAAGPGRGPAARASQAVGDMREDTLRLGTFIELLKKGENTGTASRKVREFLFDYGEVGAFVEAARRFWLPFVTFPSKAIPNTLREFARNPGRGASIAKTISASEELAGNPDMSYLPPWAGSSFAIPSTPLIRRIIGAPEDQTLSLNPERVTGFAALDLLDPRPSEIRMNYLAGLVSPLPRVPVEAVTGYSAFRGRTYRPGERVYAPQVVQLLHRLGVPIPHYGPKRDVYSGEERPGYSPTLDTILKTLPIYGQSAQFLPARQETGRLGLVKYLAGLPISPYDYLRGAYYAEKYGGRR